MTTNLQTLSWATFGTVAMLTIGNVSSVVAAELITYPFSGTTGTSNSSFYPEYQNANFEGFFTIDPNTPDLDPNDYGNGVFEVIGFELHLSNPAYPHFASFFGQGPDTRTTIVLDDWTGGSTDADVDNSSQDNPKKADFQLYFNDTNFDLNTAPTRAPYPNTFVPYSSETPFSFLILKNSATAPDLLIPVLSAVVTKQAEAVPEPTTMAGAAVFGLGVLLKKRAKKR